MQLAENENLVFIIGLLLTFLLIVVPTLAFTARLVLKPMLETLLQLREALAEGAAGGKDGNRLTRLEVELRELQDAVRGLEGAVKWDRALLEGGDQYEPRLTEREPSPR